MERDGFKEMECVCFPLRESTSRCDSQRHLVFLPLASPAGEFTAPHSLSLHLEQNPLRFFLAVGHEETQGCHSASQDVWEVLSKSTPCQLAPAKVRGKGEGKDRAVPWGLVGAAAHKDKSS